MRSRGGEGKFDSKKNVCDSVRQKEGKGMVIFPGARLQQDLKKEEEGNIEGRGVICLREGGGKREGAAIYLGGYYWESRMDEKERYKCRRK